MKKTFLLASITSVALLAGCGNSSDKAAAPTASTVDLTNIRIATESNYKPFSYMDANGKHQGFEIDLIGALCEEMKATCTIESYPWDSLIPGLQADKYDAIFASMSDTEERRKTVTFSEPYFMNKLVLVGKKDDAGTIADIGGKVVAAQQATVASQYIEKNHPDAKLKIYDKQVNAYLDLAAGRVDYLLSDIGPASDWLSTAPAENFAVKGEPIDINDKVAIAMRQSDTELAAAFNGALASLKANGKYAEIAARHFDASVLADTPK